MSKRRAGHYVYARLVNQSPKIVIHHNFAILKYCCKPWKRMHVLRRKRAILTVFRRAIRCYFNL